MTNSEQGQIGNIDLVKQLNGAVVYRLIDQKGPISRIQIAEISQLAPASVTKITRQLLDRGLIKEVDQQASTGGRRATSIITETRLFHTVAIRLGRNDATIALYNLSGKILAEELYQLPQRTQKDVESILLTSIEKFIHTYQHKIRELIAISLVLPGLIDSLHGIVHYMPHINVNNWALVSILEAHFNVACFVGHDIRSLALAEHYFGASRDSKDSILIRLHRGVGAGIIVNSKIFLTNNGNLGEIGHIQIDPLGERCYCSNFGCLETVASNSAIEQRMQHLLAQGYTSLLSNKQCTIKDICQAANQGDTLAKEMITQVGDYLGRAIAIIINLLNPQKVVIAGEIIEAKETLLSAIGRCIDRQALPNFRESIPIVTSALDHYSAISAFALVKHALLNGILLQRLIENRQRKS